MLTAGYFKEHCTVHVPLVLTKLCLKYITGDAADIICWDIDPNTLQSFQSDKITSIDSNNYTIEKMEFQFQLYEEGEELHFRVLFNRSIQTKSNIVGVHLEVNDGLNPNNMLKLLNCPDFQIHFKLSSQKQLIKILNFKFYLHFVGDHQYGDEIAVQTGVRAWRYDSKLQKWRRRGKGQITLYHNALLKTILVAHTDELHHKVRMLQKIDRNTVCCKKENGTEGDVACSQVSWNADDYSYYFDDKPCRAKWKVRFITESEKMQTFINIFNTVATLVASRFVGYLYLNFTLFLNLEYFYRFLSDFILLDHDRLFGCS